MLLRYRFAFLRGARDVVILTFGCLLITLNSITSAQAMNIQKVVSQKGIVAWLVEDHTLPLLAMQFGFTGGSSQDPQGKEGLAYFVSGVLDEGAGEIKSREFQEKLEDLAIQMSFDANRDAMTGGVKTLTKNKDEAFDLLRLALTQARMDTDAVERVRGQIYSVIKINDEDPDNVASDAWFAHVFKGHPYGTRTKGSLETIGAITPHDLKTYTAKNFARSNLFVAVVGDITAADLSVALDRVFGDLPERADLKIIEDATWNTKPRQLIIPMATPQTIVNFGLPGPKRQDPDFVPAYVLNYIVGGGGFASKLMEEVREKRGLAYSVYTYLYPFDHAGVCFGSVATENKRVAESIQVIKQVLADIAENGPTAEELENAKRYLTGSYALRFSSSGAIAQILLWIQIEDLGIDYIDKRNSLIDAVTIEDVKRVAKLMKPDELVLTVVGQPDGMMPAKESKPAAVEASPRG
jgi:zinc protease